MTNDESKILTSMVENTTVRAFRDLANDAEAAGLNGVDALIHLAVGMIDAAAIAYATIAKGQTEEDIERALDSAFARFRRTFAMMHKR